MVQALLRFGRPADVYCGKITRNVNRILCTGQPGFTSLLKIQILPNAGLLRRLRRETGRFQNDATRVTGAIDLARQRRGCLEKLKQYKGFGTEASQN